MTRSSFRTANLDKKATATIANFKETISDFNKTGFKTDRLFKPAKYKYNNLFKIEPENELDDYLVIYMFKCYRLILQQKSYEKR